MQLGGVVSIPQSGFGAFEPRISLPTSGVRQEVSIPQSGFGAFEHMESSHGGPYLRLTFQSLSRDSGRLNTAG